MIKLLSVAIIASIIFLSSSLVLFAADGPTLTASLDSLSPAAQSIAADAQSIDVARITISASGGDVYLNGIYLGTDVSGGLSNFTDIYIYDTYDNSLVGIYPNQSEKPNLVSTGNITLGSGLSKTYLVRANFAASASGIVRLGFSGFTFATLATPTLVGVPTYGNALTLPGVVATPTPAPSSSPTPMPSITPTPTPLATPIGNTLITPASRGFISLAALNLKEGDTISASGSSDPDIYIANEWGYKRLFLNPVIFSFYGHLGGFSKVKNINPSARDIMVTSGLFRNCEASDQKVYGIEATGEDAGVLHWINTTGTQALADDPDFFKKVFCINTKEFNWYSIGTSYSSVNQVPAYSR